MPEYIERDALRTEALKLTGMDEFAFDNCFPYWQFSKCIKDAPEADVEPVVHGKWIQSQRLHGNPGWEIGRCWAEIVYQCSICGRVSTQKEPYCNCGARMDLEDKP
jgi:hypothetical protein